MKRFIYIRSSEEQNELRQLTELLLLKEVRIDECDIFIENESEECFARDQYQVLKQSLRERDVIYLNSLNSLGINRQMILDEWEVITEQIRADIIVLDMPFLDTTLYRESNGICMSNLIRRTLPWIAEDVKQKQRERVAEKLTIIEANQIHLDIEYMK